MDPTNQINEEIRRGARWIPALLFLLLLTLLAGVLWAMIQTPKDLEHRAIRTLQDTDLSQNDFKLRFSGRDAELWWGADDAAQERAVALIESVPGVRQVTLRRYPAQIARATTSFEEETPATDSSSPESHEPETGDLVTTPGAPREPAQTETAVAESNADLAGSNRAQAVRSSPVDETSAPASPSAEAGTSVSSNEPGPTGQTSTITTPPETPSPGITEAGVAPARVSPGAQDRGQAPHEGEVAQGVPPGPPAAAAIPSTDPTAPSETQPPTTSPDETEASSQEGESGPDQIEPAAQPSGDATEAGTTPVEGEEPEVSRPALEYEVGTEGPATHGTGPSPTDIESAKLAQSPGSAPESGLPMAGATQIHEAAITPIEPGQPEPTPAAPEQGGGGAPAPSVPVASGPEEAAPPAHELLTGARAAPQAAADASTPQTTAAPIQAVQVPPPEEGRETAPPFPDPEGGVETSAATTLSGETSGTSPLLPQRSVPIPAGEAGTVDTDAGESTPHAGPLAATPRRTVLGRMLFVPGTAHPSPRGYAAIVQIAQIMRAQPDLRIEIRGYGERLSFGPHLGVARALTVKRYLMAIGIPASRLLALPYRGQTGPALGPGPEVLQIRFIVF